MYIGCFFSLQIEDVTVDDGKVSWSRAKFLRHYAQVLPSALQRNQQLTGVS